MTGNINHGGALDRAIARYGGRRAQWLDLSTGINPEGIEIPEMGPDIWRRLPEQGLLENVVARARAFYGVPDGAAIVAAPGTQSLIQILPELLGGTGTVLIAGPTYGEYAASFGRAGWTVVDGEAAKTDIDTRAAVIVNPNNPDGRLTGPDTIERLAGTFRQGGGVMVIDEAFQEASNAESAVSLVPGGGLVVFKSFGKFFGLAGIRLGFAIATPELTGRIAARLGPWAVSAPALAVADSVLGNELSINAMRARISESSTMLQSVLIGARLETIGGTQLFSLVRHPRAGELAEALCRRHVLVRHFDYRPDWLRFGLACRADYPRLRDAIDEAMKEISG